MMSEALASEHDQNATRSDMSCWTVTYLYLSCLSSSKLNLARLSLIFSPLKKLGGEKINLLQGQGCGSLVQSRSFQASLFKVSFGKKVLGKLETC